MENKLETRKPTGQKSIPLSTAIDVATLGFTALSAYPAVKKIVQDVSKKVNKPK